jgi:branched-subunit amino acid transport protein
MADLESSSFAVFILVGALATYMWRALGVALSGRIDPEGPVVRWVGCVAYAVLAALIARMILLPVGSLAATPVSLRLIAAGVALGVFYLARRHLPLGVAAGGITLTLLSYSLSYWL